LTGIQGPLDAVDSSVKGAVGGTAAV